MHSISGGSGPSWLEITFHQQSWGGNGDAVFNLDTNTWSLVTAADIYWSGHVAMGNGKFTNSSGSADGRDSRGMLVRDANNLMNTSSYRFVGQPPNTLNGWCDADHSSWFNSTNNPNAPILVSRYTIGSACNFAFTGEILAAAVDGSNTVWRFAHNHNGGQVCYYAQAFAQISNDGKWALFSSYWDGTLGADTSFGCSTRVDTFIVELVGATSAPDTLPPPPLPAPPLEPTTTSVTRVEQNGSGVTYTGSWCPNTRAILSGGSAVLAMDTGSRASLAFNGTGVTWIGYMDAWSGIANVYVDGTLRGAIDTYAAADTAKKAVYSISGLPSGSHTLAIEVTGRRNASSAGLWVWVDAFDVTSESGTPTTPTTTTTPAPVSTFSFNIANRDGVSSITSGSGSAVTVGYGRIQPDGGSTTPSGIAIFGYTQNNVLVSEAAVPAAPLVQSARIYAEIGSSVNTGVAIANPNAAAVTISFYFTDASGTNLNSGSTTIEANGQIAAFLNETLFSSPSTFQGTFTVNASAPISLVALRGLTNERSEFLITTLPVTPVDAQIAT